MFRHIPVLVISCILFAWSYSFACQCKSIEPLDKSYTEQFDLVVYGNVDSVGVCKENALAFFTIEKLFKGRSEAHIVVRFDCTTDCQMSFDKGDKWLLYLNYVDYNTLEVNLCDRNRKSFQDPAEDFYTTSYGSNLKDELLLLAKVLGEKKIASRNEFNGLQRELIKPKGYNMLWVLVGSLVVLGLLFYFLKAFRK